MAPGASLLSGLQHPVLVPLAVSEGQRGKELPTGHTALLSGDCSAPCCWWHSLTSVKTPNCTTNRATGQRVRVGHRGYGMCCILTGGHVTLGLCQTHRTHAKSRDFYCT